jgi:molybdate transport system substrate-binding protein
MKAFALLRRSVCAASALLLTAAVFGGPAAAGEVKAAVAANFTAPMREIAARFLEASGHRVVASYGATGLLYSQVHHGAPFDVFLAADEEHPQRLAAERLAVDGTRFTYAIGRLVLWSPRADYVDAGGGVLEKGDFRHLAIANPKLAPYGAAAQEVLERRRLWQRLQPRIVWGQNVTQTYQFVASGNAELGFVALSQVPEGGSRWLVPQASYAPLRQDAVLLARGRDNPAARAFLEYLRGPQAAAIITRHGYVLR